MRLCILAVIIAAILGTGDSAWTQQKSDFPLSPGGVHIAATQYFQDWGYSTDPYEYVTCIAYYAHPGTRFTKAPLLTSVLPGDHTGWSTSISADRMSVFVFGARSHFGPNPAGSYAISYKVYYDGPNCGQDTVIWNGNTPVWLWARTGTPGNGGAGVWQYSPVPLLSTHDPISTSWLYMTMSGQVNSPSGQPYVGESQQVGPVMFGTDPGPWGAINSYSASLDLGQVSGDLPLYGWAMNGEVKFVDPVNRVQLSQGSWWVYYTPITDWPIEEGNYIMMTSWKNGWDQPAEVSGKFWSLMGSTVVSPPWPVDYMDWSSIGIASFNGTLDNAGTLSGGFYVSKNKLVLRTTGGEDFLFVKPGGGISLELQQRTMTCPGTGYQAFMSFDPSRLSLLSAGYTASPYGLAVITPIVATLDGNIDMAAGINVFNSQRPYATDSKLGDLVFRAGQTECITQVMFRDHDPSSTFTDDQGNPIITQTTNGPFIVVDGTPPTQVSVTADPADYTNSTTMQFTFSATDALSGVLYYELKLDDLNWYTASSPNIADISTLADGPHEVTVRAVDQAGNAATSSAAFYTDYTAPTVSIDSITQNGGPTLIPGGTAIQGSVDIYVTANDATSGIKVPPIVEVVPNGATAQNATFVDNSGVTYHYVWNVLPTTPNGIATVNASATDAAGNVTAALPTTFNVNKSQATVTVGLEGVYLPSVKRWIRFVLGGSGGTVAPFTVLRQVDFSGGVATITITNLPTTGSWTRISAKDEQHTLRKTINMVYSGDGQWSANFTGANRLIGGDLNNDNLIDIVDFGVYASQFGTSPSLTTQWPTKNANVSCDGFVDTNDFSFIQIHFLSKGDIQVGYALTAAAAGPRTLIGVLELARSVGLASAVNADLNKDGVVSSADVSLFIQKYMNVKRGR